MQGKDKRKDSASADKEILSMRPQKSELTRKMMSKHKCDEFFACEMSSQCENGEKCCVSWHSER